MIEKEIMLSPEVAFNQEKLIAAVLRQMNLKADQVSQLVFVKRSVDARGRAVKVRILVRFYPKGDKPSNEYKVDYPHVKNAPAVIIVGAGPAGLFAALRLIELGMKPIILERGKDVQARRRDLAAINKDHIVNPESNYCFGEGGAGTYSDGKLYTRSKKRGDVQRILHILVNHGASEDILMDAHPHIGTNKLPKIIQEIRERIIFHGGEIHFNTRVCDFIIRNGEMAGVELQNGDKKEGQSVILATGHSARDIFELCRKRSVKVEAKPFALGVRVEHPQQLIDRIQYKCDDRGDWLPASSYALVHQTYYQKLQRGVFSFCMCPGGFIVPAATAPGEIVVNGMSPSRRNSRYANSGIVVAVENEDLRNYAHHQELMGVAFQRDIEQKACTIAGGTQVAPAQRLVDFIQGKVSASLPDSSYQPGLHSVSMDDVLPSMISERLKDAFKAYGKKMKGYFTNEAQIVGVESRTSSPVKIPRHKESLEHVEIKRLFPCGEGAGYAGGIVSAAMDGERCAERVVAMYKKY